MASCYAADGCRNEVIQVAICWCGQLQGSEANVVERLIVKKHAFVGVLHQLVEREHCIVRLYNCIRDLWRRNDRERLHDTIGILFTDFGNQQGAHACTRSTSKRMAELKTLKAVTSLSLLADDIEHGVYELSALCIMSLCPVVACASLAKHEIIRAEKLAERTSANAVHRTGLQIHEDCAGHVTTSCGLVVVHINSFKLQVRIAMIRAG